VKCAQVDPILEEEFIQLKQANWFTEGLMNARRGVSGVFETAAGGIGGAGAAIWGAGEAATDALGWTDATNNTGFDTAGTMFQGAGAGIKNIGRSVGVEGLDAASDAGQKNYFNDVHENTMDRAGYTEAQKRTSRNILAGGRGAGELAALAGVTGVAASAVHGARAAGAGSRLAGLTRGTLTGIRGNAPTLVQGLSPFAPVQGSRLALLTQPHARFLQFGARNAALPMTGLPGAAGYGGTAAQLTGAPFVGEGVGFTTTQLGRLIGSSRMAGLGRGISALRPGLAPALPTAIGGEVALQLGDEYLYKPTLRAAGPSTSHSPHTYSDEQGFNAYAAMPQQNRPGIGPENAEIRLPGKEVWPEALRKAQTDPDYTSADAFADSLKEFQRNGGAQVNPVPIYETARDRSMGQILPFNLQNAVYPDQSPPTIELNDPAAALDFVSGPVEGFVGLMTEEQSKARISGMLAKLGREVTPDELAKMSSEFLASPNGQQMLTGNRIQLLDLLKDSMDPVQHQSLLDVYSGQGISMQLSDVPEVHIPAPQQQPVKFNPVQALFDKPRAR
jgi:hypothetical protein